VHARLDDRHGTPIVRNVDRLLQGERAFFAEDVTPFGQPLGRNPWDHLVDDERDVVVGPDPIFLRDLVGAEERRHRHRWHARHSTA
jgi:hypothetical protein